MPAYDMSRAYPQLHILCNERMGYMRKDGIMKTKSTLKRKRILKRVYKTGKKRFAKRITTKGIKAARIKRKRRIKRIRRVRRIKLIRRIKRKKMLIWRKRRKRLKKLKLSRNRNKFRLRKKARRKKHKQVTPPNNVPIAPPPSPISLMPKGVNLIGFTRAVIGLGESGRLAAKSLETTDISYGILNFPVNVSNKIEDMTWAHKEIDKAIYQTNLFHMNADYIGQAKDHFGDDLFLNRVNIGYWHWELLNMREEDTKGFELVHEVWVPTTFVQEAILKRATVSVVKIPHGIEVEVAPQINRASFGLPPDRFLFYVMYDAQSHTTRKNPQAVIEAFKRAFIANDPNVGLVIKINNMNVSPAIFESMQQLTSEYNNIYLIDSALSRTEVNSLLNCTDAYVSLHRSEGFGLGLAEAMYLGKPVIGTNWSGNTDFMNAANSCPVSYTMVPITETWGPYSEGEIWAEPDINHAAEYMIRLVTDPDWRYQIAYNGQQTIRNEFSPEIHGQRVKERLISLGLL